MTKFTKDKHEVDGDQIVMTQPNYGGWALLPMVLFISLYMGCGVVFTMIGIQGPFTIMSRQLSALIAIIVSLLCFEPKGKMSKKIEYYCQCAGRKGVMHLGLIVMMAGGFASATAAIGGKDSIVNLGIELIPNSFLVPGKIGRAHV